MEKKSRKPSQIIGMLLKQARMQAGYTQKTVCEYFGWSIARLSEYENNKVTPGIDTIEKLARLYNKEFVMILASDKERKIIARLNQ